MQTPTSCLRLKEIGTFHKSMRKQIQNRKNRKSNRRQNLVSNQNSDQQQNVVTTRRALKIRDIKIPSKYWYDYQGQVSMVLGGNVRQIVLPKQGLNADERIGNKIVTTKIEMRYFCTTAPTDIFNQVRLLLVYAPNPSVVIQSVLDLDGAGQISPLSFTKAYSTGTVFQVLWDQVHILNPQSSNATVQGEISIPCRLPSTWDYNQNFESGFFALIWVGDSSFTPHPTLTFNLRAQYHDL